MTHNSFVVSLYSDSQAYRQGEGWLFGSTPRKKSLFFESTFCTVEYYIIKFIAVSLQTFNYVMFDIY